MSGSSKLLDIWRTVVRRKEISSIKASGLFEPDLYLSNPSVQTWRGDPVVHYVLYGEGANFRASSLFDPAFYRGSNPDVVAGGGNLFAHWIRFGRSEGRRPADDASYAQYLRSKANASLSESAVIDDLIASQRFEGDFYRRQRNVDEIESGSVSDYVMHGEALGYMPSADFDPSFYLAKNPELSGLAASAFHHFIRHGAEEGRQGLPFPGLPALMRSRLDPSRPNVLLVLHELSRSGAPILGWNLATKLKKEQRCNVVILALSGGELASTFDAVADVVIAPPDATQLSGPALRSVCKLLRWSLLPEYAIANSAATADCAVELQALGTPVIALVHEFTTVFGATRDLSAYFGSMQVLVFPAEVVKDAAMDLHPQMRGRRCEVIPQGRSVVPELGKAAVAEADGNALANDASVFTVVGLGTVEWRKGVDLFVAAAASFRRCFPAVSVRFVWIGALTEHPQRQEMAMFVKEQIVRSGVADVVSLQPETSEIEAVYRTANALFVSSRLDPLPNVGIDAMYFGLPVVCFDRATGLAEYLSAHATLEPLVVPYADAHAAAAVIHELATRPVWAQSVSEKCRDVASQKFDMSRYVERLHSLGCELASASTPSETPTQPSSRGSAA